jgi:hypothetical protein
MSAVNQSTSWATNPKNRKWLLAFLVALLLFDVRLWIVWPNRSKLEPVATTALAVLLLLNHVVGSFLAPDSQRRMLVPQTILTAIVLGLAITLWIATFFR